MTTEGARKPSIHKRRKHTEEFKSKVLQEAYAPGASASEVARRYELNPNLVRYWRKRMSGGRLRRSPVQKLIRVEQVATTPSFREALPDHAAVAQVATRNGGRGAVLIIPVPVPNWSESIAALIKAVQEL